MVKGGAQWADLLETGGRIETNKMTTETIVVRPNGLGYLQQMKAKTSNVHVEAFS